MRQRQRGMKDQENHAMIQTAIHFSQINDRLGNNNIRERGKKRSLEQEKDPKNEKKSCNRIDIKKRMRESLFFPEARVIDKHFSCDTRFFYSFSIFVSVDLVVSNETYRSALQSK